MKAVTRLLLFVTLNMLSCNVPTDQEQRLISRLNERYSDYHFSASDDYLGVKLKMNLTKSEWDSLALKITYDSTIGIYKGSDGIPWVYLLVYDKSDKYLFTITKDNAAGNHIFFKE